MNTRLITILAVIAAIATIAIYTHQFDGSLSPNHTRWGEFGSFFGGVFGATFAFFSLLYLAKQVENQWRESRAARLESEITQREQYIATCLGLLLPKLKDIDESLDAPLAELIMLLHEGKQRRNVRDVVELFRAGLSARAEAMALWVNISSALSFIRIKDYQRYLNQVTIVAVQIGIGLCEALDDTVNLATDIEFERHFDRPGVNQ